METSQMDKGSLKYGDYISLKTLLHDGFLSSEGILLQDIVLHNDISLFDECLFCVHLQRQYSAARELNSFLATYEVSEESEDEDLKKYLAALQRGRNNEKELNDSYLKKNNGQVVLFGQTLQLFHVKSRKYLTVLPKTLANGERENIRLTLDVAGNSYSWLQILPRFKIDKEGDRIPTNTEVYLKVLGRPGNEYIHCADRHLNPKRYREVNCSLELTSWKLTIFQNGTDSIDKNLIMASEIIFIHDPETNTCLTLKLADIPDEGSDSESMLSETGLKSASVILAPLDESFIDSSYLWVIETESLIEGGPIQWKTEQVRIKHVNTLFYIKMVKSRDGTVYIATTRSKDDRGTVLTINEINSQLKVLQNNKPIQIGLNNEWLCRDEALEDHTYTLGTNSDRSEAVNLIVNRYIEKSMKGDDEKEAAAAAVEPLDIQIGLAGCKYLTKFLDFIVIPSTKRETTLFPDAEREDIEFFNDMIQKLIYFSNGFAISAKNVNLDTDKSDNNLKVRRQHLLREQLILENLLRILSKMSPFTKLVFSLDNHEKDLMKQVIEMGNHFLHVCFDLILSTMFDNPENQMYVADYMPIILIHLGDDQPLAGKCVTEMLSKNMELQETKISEREIAIFIDKLRGSKMGVMYFNLLQACCSCQGDGVDNNQCVVAKSLLTEESNDIIIRLEMDNSYPTPTDWCEPNIYIPVDKESGKDSIMGSDLLIKGLPKLTIKWSANDRDISLQSIYGSDTVTVMNAFHKKEKLLMRGLSKGFSGKSFKAPAFVKSSSSVRTDQGDNKQLFMNYLIAEMNLAAEMCLDRNYVAMHRLDPIFTFETLLTMIKLDIDSKVKAAAVRLLMCLHVDRDPQATTKIPCLTRTWSEVCSSPEPTLPYVEPDRRNSFALIQQLLQEHVSSMKGNRWEELSQHMLKMLKSLVVFNFYGTMDRLTDVIGPIIEVLDRRTVDFENKVEEMEEPKLLSKRLVKTGSTLEDSKEGGDLSDEAKLLSPLDIPWQRPVLDFLESIPVLLCILGLVAVAVALLIYQTVSGADDTEGSALYAIGMLIMAIFIAETTMRAYCSWYFGILQAWLQSGFNQIDMLVISLDIMFLCLPTNTSGGGGFAKMLRLLRLLRLLRILRAARVVNALVSKKSTVVWKPPIRYGKAPLYELNAMLESINILSYCQQVCEDRNISVFLRHFYEWNSGDKRSPSEIYKQIMEDCNKLSLGVNDFDNVMVDVIMFVHAPLVQSTLELLISHHSMKSTLLNNINSIQLLVSNKRERQCKLVDQMLKQLERNAETHELWGELESREHHETNKQTKNILKELTEILKIKRTELEFDSDYMPDVEMQNLFRNLGCFEISMKLMGLIDSVDPEEDGSFSEVAQNTRDLCYLGNQLLYWFFISNPNNQDMGYEELAFFLDTLDKGIKSHNIIRAIFKDNEVLMKVVPHDNLTQLADKIIKDGHKHFYLSLFASISYCGEKNLPKNQLFIAITLTSPGSFPKIKSFLCPTTTEEYAEKTALMAPHLDAINVDVDDLPEELAYHATLIEVLSSCTMGKLNITTVEAKVQSVYNYVDIVKAILDPNAMLFIKIRLALHLLNALIEVEMKIPGLEQSACVWALLKSFSPTFQFAKDDVRGIEKLGLGHENVDRQKLEWMIVSINILGSFFERYYNPLSLRREDGSTSTDRVQITLNQVNLLISGWFNNIRMLYDMDTPILPRKYKAIIYNCLIALNNSATSVIVTSIDATHLVDHEAAAAAEDMSTEAVVSAKYKEFLDVINADEDIKREAETESLNFIAVMESLPLADEDASADVRYEHFIKKLVVHIRDSFKIINEERRLEPRVSKTATWVIKAFRTMIENKMGMTIFERDKDGGEEQDEAAWPVVNALNICGATTLCLELIAVGIEEPLMNEAVMLCVALLYKEGGALEVQTLMNKFLQSNSELFFKQCRASIQKLIAWHKWNGITELKEGEEPNLPPELIIVRFLQLTCEGHFGANQDIVREQPGNKQQTNLLDDFVLYLNTLSRIPCRTTTQASAAVAATILEVLQGPCAGNQAHLALNTELLETMNRMLRAKVVRDCDPDEELDLKFNCIKILQGLLEGQGLKSVVYERVISVIHMDIIQQIAKPFDDIETFDEETGEVTITPAEMSEAEKILQTSAMVLLQMFCNFKPSLADELGISTSVEDLTSSGTACIEVFWRGELNKRFFYIPQICHDLAKSTKDKFVEDVDRSSIENKLLDMLAQAPDMYREVKHLQVLKDKNLNKMFSPQIQDTVTWITFILSCIVNALFVIFYDASSGEPKLTTSARSAISALNIIMLVFAFFSILQYLVVKSPVVFESSMSCGETFWQSVYITATDGKIIYYCLYLALNFLGIMVADYFLTFLLLDIVVKNSTTRDVLNAVIFPRKQLGMTILLAVFILYIYAFFLFYYFREDVALDVCSTLWGCVKFMFGTGMRQGGGVGDILPFTVGSRWLLDTTFYIIVSIMILNIVFGIIIDTFSSLRSDKLDRMADTTGICFVCGIDEQTFDRASKLPEGFQRHVKLDHNMWNYLFFIFHLWEQDKDDDDGLEQYVRLAVEANEITWLPMNKAMCLTMSATEFEELRDQMLDKIEDAENKIENDLAALRLDLKYKLDILGKAGQQTYDRGKVRDGISTYVRNVRATFKDAEEKEPEEGVEEGEAPVVEKLWRLVFLNVVSMLLPSLNELELSNVGCRIICDSGVFSLPNKGLDEKSEVLFEPDYFNNICPNGLEDDKRTVQVQALIVESKDIMGRFLGIAEIPISDLMTVDDEDELFEWDLTSPDGKVIGQLSFKVQIKDDEEEEGSHHS